MPNTLASRYLCMFELEWVVLSVYHTCHKHYIYLYAVLTYYRLFEYSYTVRMDFALLNQNVIQCASYYT